MGSVLGGDSDYQARVAAAQLEEQKKEAEKMRAKAEADKRDLLEKQQSSITARQRGGARALLSTASMGTQEGLKDTLGG